MIGILVAWFIGMVTIAVFAGTAMMLYLAYAMYFESYYIWFMAVAFFVLPVFVGFIASSISDWNYDRKILRKLRRTEDEE